MIDSKNNLKFLLASCVLLTGCQTTAPENERPLLKVDMHAHEKEEGLVILESAVIGETSAQTTSLHDSDCIEGRGLGVMTSSVQGDNRHLFAKTGQPCERATTLFDGKFKVNQRSADPGINIAFVDKYGAKPEPVVDILPSFAGELMIENGDSPEDMALTNAEGLMLADPKEAAPLQGEGDAFQQKLATITDKNMLPEDWDYQKVLADAEAPKRQKELAETIKSWHEEREHQKLVKDAEKLLSSARTLERKSSHELIAEHQEEISTLVSRLREAEKMQEFQRERERLLQEQLIQVQSQLQSQQRSQVQTQQQMAQEVTVMEQRAREYKKLAHEMKEDKDYNEKMLRKRISDLKRQLVSAEKSADKQQQQLLLDAAQQLALAEDAARKFNAQKKGMLERQAEEKKTQAAYLAEKANQIQVSSPVQLPEFTEIAFLETPESKLEKRLMLLESRVKALQAPEYNGEDLEAKGFAGTLVTLNVEDEPLDSILRSALAQAMPSANWEMEWELSDFNSSIKDEKWTVVAEARMDEILAYVKEKVKQAHGADIEFRRFENGGLFIVSDKPVQ